MSLSEDVSLAVEGFPEQTDIVIICMIPDVELAAIRDELNRIGAVFIGCIHTDQKEERYRLKSKKRDTNIVVTCLGSQSNMDSAITTLSMLYRYSPRHIFLYGIAGGMQKEKYQRGTVVIGSDIVFRKISKVVDDEKYLFEMPPVATTPHGQIIAREFMTNLPSSAIEQHPKKDWGTFKVVHEKIFTWDLVLDSPTVRDKMLALDRKLSVVEMEAAGFFKAIHHYKNYFIARNFNKSGKNGEVDGLIIRGVSDYAAHKAESDAELFWRKMAADNASYILMKIIHSMNNDDHSFS